MAAKTRGNSSAIIVARLLATEGFTDHTANQVERYWKRRAGLSPRQERQIEGLEKELSKIAQKLSASERLTLGRFIGLHKKMAFDTGLKIGLQAFAQRMDKPVEIETAVVKPKRLSLSEFDERVAQNIAKSLDQKGELSNDHTE